MEWVPFAARLAERTANLVQTAVLPVGDGLWTLIVEQLLLPVIDTDLQARPELAVVVTFLFCTQSWCVWLAWKQVQMAPRA